MSRIRTARAPRLIWIIAVLAGLAANANAELCAAVSNRESLHYTWSLRSGFSWIVGLRFPTRGKATFVNERTATGIESRLRIAGLKPEEGYYLYESAFDSAGDRAFMSRIDYEWGHKKRDETTKFDYEKMLARVVRISHGQTTNKVRTIPPGELRDVLTGIHTLRIRAANMQEPFTAQIYSDGKSYPVLFRRVGTASVKVKGEKLPATEFVITAAPGAEAKWPGGLRVWLSNDARRIPLRIALQRSFASLDLTLTETESCWAELRPELVPKAPAR